VPSSWAPRRRSRPCASGPDRRDLGSVARRHRARRVRLRRWLRPEHHHLLGQQPGRQPAAGPGHPHPGAGGVHQAVRDQGEPGGHPWSDLLDRITNATTSGEGPDVVNIGNTWSASLQATGAFVEFDDATLGKIGGKAKFLETSLSSTGAPGKTATSVPLYGCPTRCSTTSRRSPTPASPARRPTGRSSSRTPKAHQPAAGKYGLALAGASYTRTCTSRSSWASSTAGTTSTRPATPPLPRHRMSRDQAVPEPAGHRQGHHTRIRGEQHHPRKRSPTSPPGAQR